MTLGANIVVIVGLIFLGFEINQNTRAIAAASEEVTNQSLDYFALGMDNQVIARALHKQAVGTELDGFERDQLWRHQYYNFRVSGLCLLPRIPLCATARINRTSLRRCPRVVPCYV